MLTSLFYLLLGRGGSLPSKYGDIAGLLGGVPILLISELSNLTVGSSSKDWNIELLIVE